MARIHASSKSEDLAVLLAAPGCDDPGASPHWAELRTPATAAPPRSVLLPGSGPRSPGLRTAEDVNPTCGRAAKSTLWLSLVRHRWRESSTVEVRGSDMRVTSRKA